jgi:glycosyltransferase involved in cell wall biosynthesis
MQTLRIIALAPNDWDGMWMNRQQLLSRLGTRHQILYSTGARSTWDREFLARAEGGLFGSFALRDPVVIDHPPLLPFRIPGIGWLDRMAIRLIASRWRRQLDKFGNAPLVAYLFHPDYELFLDALRPDYLVYHAYDLLGRSYNAELEGRQARLLREADLIIASSKVIAEELNRRSGRQVHVVPNGVDFEAFARQVPGPEPSDLADLPHPRIAHVGRLNRKIDIELVMTLARRHPEWSFALIGPVVDVDDRERAIYEESKSIRNLHLLGAKSRSELPNYLHALDVGIMAYRTGVLWTEGIYPLKLHEYLASGLPIVSADIPAVRDFRDVVRVAVTVEEWSEAIAAAFADTLPDRRALRINTARANSWIQRADTVAELLQLELPVRPSSVRRLRTPPSRARDPA